MAPVCLLCAKAWRAGSVVAREGGGGHGRSIRLTPHTSAGSAMTATLHVCHECGRPKDLQLFVLALNGTGRQMRGYFHPRCFKKVQRKIIDATRKCVLVSATDVWDIDTTGTPRGSCGCGVSFAEAGCATTREP